MQRLIANDLTAHAEAATLFLLLSLLLLLPLPPSLSTSLSSSKDGRNGGWVGFGGSDFLARPQARSRAQLVSFRFGPLSAAFAAYLCISLYFLSRTRCAASQPKQRADSSCAAGPFAHQRALLRTRKTIFSFFAGQQVSFFFFCVRAFSL